jgi:TPR repeat protein
MIYRIVGDEQIYQWIKHTPSAKRVLDTARRHIKNGQFEKAYPMLEPLIASGDPEALFLGAMASKPGESAEEYERRHLEWLRQSAEQEYPQALYALGVYYDTGDMVGLDKIRAAQLFKRAAELKHAQSQCIHGEDLLYGAHGIEKDEAKGMAYVLESAKAKFQGALELLALFYEKGEFGFPIDPEKVASLRAEAKGEHVIGY